MISTLWRGKNYKSSIKYLINTYIREYDLSKANINALLYTGRINREEYNRLYSMDKKDREVLVGLMIKEDNTIYKSISDGIEEARKRLFVANQIEDYEVLSIRNDAVFVQGRPLQYTSFKDFIFVMKNEYTMYLKLQELEIFYSDTIDINTGELVTNIDIKGMSEYNMSLHSNGLLGLICDICYRLQREKIESTMSWIIDIYEKFIKRELPKEYYRTFDHNSGYNIPTFIRSANLFDIDDSMISIVDINRNLLILRDIVSIISDIYRTKIK